MPDSPIILNEREARKARATVTRIDRLLSSNSYVSDAQGSFVHGGDKVGHRSAGEMLVRAA